MNSWRAPADLRGVGHEAVAGVDAEVPRRLDGDDRLDRQPGPGRRRRGRASGGRAGRALARGGRRGRRGRGSRRALPATSPPGGCRRGPSFGCSDSAVPASVSRPVAIRSLSLVAVSRSASALAQLRSDHREVRADVAVEAVVCPAEAVRIEPVGVGHRRGRRRPAGRGRPRTPLAASAGGRRPGVVRRPRRSRRRCPPAAAASHAPPGRCSAIAAAASSNQAARWPTWSATVQPGVTSAAVHAASGSARTESRRSWPATAASSAQNASSPPRGRGAGCGSAPNGSSGPGATRSESAHGSMTRGGRGRGRGARCRPSPTAASLRIVVGSTAAARPASSAGRAASRRCRRGPRARSAPSGSRRRSLKRSKSPPS